MRISWSLPIVTVPCPGQRCVGLEIMALMEPERLNLRLLPSAAGAGCVGEAQGREKCLCMGRKIVEKLKQFLVNWEDLPELLRCEWSLLCMAHGSGVVTPGVNEVML